MPTTTESLDAIAVQPGRHVRVGLLHYVAKGDPFVGTEDIAEFKSAMGRLGYREGANIAYDERYGRRDKVLTQHQANELVAAAPDVICSFLTNANLSLKRATEAEGRAVPVVCWGSDLLEAGLIESYRRPGRNFTGFTYEPYTQWTKVRFLKIAVPGLSRLAHLYNPTYSPAPAVLRELRQAAVGMRLEFHVYEALRVEDFAAAIAAMKRDGCTGAIIGPHELFNRNGEALGRLFADSGIAALGNQLSITRGGGLATISSPRKRGWPLMAHVVQRILEGADPAVIPIERSMKGPLTINLGSARALGLALPTALLDEADALLG